jgi:hypothetical protein
MKYFLDEEHKNRFINMVTKDNTYFRDIERVSLFYIISGNYELYINHRYVYDCREHRICFTFKELGINFSSGIISLIKLAFNLYNGWADEDTTPLNLLSSLDNINLKLASNAIKIRFNSNLLDELYSE